MTRNVPPNFHAADISPPPVGGLSHPHLMFDQAELEKVRTRIKAGRPKIMWRWLTDRCRTYMDPAADAHVDYKERRRDFWGTRRGHGETLSKVCDLALAGLIARDEKLGRYAVGILMAIAREGAGKEGRGMNHGYVFPGWTLVPTWSWFYAQHGMAYDWAAPFMQPDELADLREFLFDRVQYAWDMRGATPNGIHNIALGVNIAPATLALAFWGDMEHPLLGEYPRYAIPNAEDYLDDTWYADGASNEGQFYGLMLGHCLRFAHILNRKGIAHRLLDPRPAMLNVPVYYALLLEPNGMYFTMNDCFDEFISPDPMWLYHARQFGHPLSRWLWRKAFDLHEDQPDELKSHEFRSARYREARACGTCENLLECDDDDEAKGPQELGLRPSHHFKKQGIVVARKDFEKDTPLFRLLGGRRCLLGHQHWDALSFSLSAFGERLAVDAGYCYKGWEHLKTPGQGSTAAHCSLLLNGRGQETLCGNNIPGLINWHEQQGDLEFIMASAFHHYGGGLPADGYGLYPHGFDPKADPRIGSLSPTRILWRIYAAISADRMAAVVHAGDTPFYIVICDMFDYPPGMAESRPELGYVLLAPEEAKLEEIPGGALIEAPKASLRADLVTDEGVTCRRDDFAGMPRLVWGRRGEHGRFLTVLTPFKDGIATPKVELLQDDRSATACRVRFGDHEDTFTFKPHGRYIELEGKDPQSPGYRQRFALVRKKDGQVTGQMEIPPLAGPYVVR
jgi:hypothetical protein